MCGHTASQLWTCPRERLSSWPRASSSCSVLSVSSLSNLLAATSVFTSTYSIPVARKHREASETFCVSHRGLLLIEMFICGSRNCQLRTGAIKSNFNVGEHWHLSNTPPKVCRRTKTQLSPSRSERHYLRHKLGKLLASAVRVCIFLCGNCMLINFKYVREFLVVLSVPQWFRPHLHNFNCQVVLSKRPDDVNVSFTAWKTEEWTSHH